MKKQLPTKKTVAKKSTSKTAVKPETLWRDALTTAPIALWVLDRNGVYTVFEGNALKATGVKPGEHIGKSIFDIYAKREDILEPVRQALAGEACVARIDNRGVVTETSFTPQRTRAGKVKGVVAVSTLVTGQVKVEKELSRVNRALRLISDCNQALVRATDENALLQEICHLIVTEGGYRFCWVGYAQKDSHKTVWPMANAGFDDGYLSTLRITWADSSRGRGPTGTAIRSGKPIACRDIKNDAAFTPWREEALKRGYRSSLVLPLKSGAESFGALNIYSAEVDRFDEHEVKMLTELADDLAFGIMALRDRMSREQADELIRLTNEKLEQEVQERTAELEELNTELEAEVRERMRAEGVLRQSELKYQIVADNTYDWEFWLSPEGEFIYVSPSCQRITGYSAARFLREPGLHVTIVHPDDRAAFTRHLELAPQGKTALFEFRIVHRDKGIRWIEQQCQPVYDEDKRYLGLRGGNRDITERRLADKIVREQAQLLSLAHDAIVVRDFDDHVLYWSDGAEKTYGYTREEATGAISPELLQTEFPIPLEDIKAAVLRDGQFSCELVQTRKDGKRIVVDSRWALRKENGIPAAMLQINRDITERRQAQQEVASLALFPEEDPNPVVRVDMNGQMLYANRAARTLFESDGWHDGQPLPAVLLKHAQRAISTGKSLDFDFESRNKEFFLFVCTVLPGKPYLNLYGRNITKRKRAEDALHKSEQRWATTLSSIGDAVIATDSTGQVTFMNRVAEELTGWKLSEATAKSAHEVFHIVNEATRAEVDSPITKVLREGVIVGLANHTVLIRKDRTEVPIDDSGAPIRDAEGNITGVVLVFRDISERKAAEKHLTFQAHLLANVHDAVFATDSSNIITDWNHAAEELYGWTATEAVGQSVLEMVRPLDTPEGATRLMDELRMQGQYRGERVHHRRDGQAIWVDASASVLKDAAGTVLGFVMANRDITKRKNAEEALRRRTEELQRVMDLAPIALWVANDPECTDIIGNAEANRFYEARAGENVSANVTGVRRFFENGRELSAQELPMQKAAALGADVRDVQLDVLRPSGEWMTIWGSATPLRDEKGRVRGCVGAFVDVTARKEAEVKLRESEERYRSLFENMLNGFAYCEMIFDEAGNPVDFVYEMVNGAFDTLTGLHDVVGKKVSEVIPGIREANPEVFEIYGRVARTGIPEQFEVDLGVLNMWLSISVYSHEPGHFVAVFENITARKQAEQALKDANESLERRVQERTAELQKAMDAVGAERQRFNHVLNALPVYVCLLTPDYHAAFVNQVFKERFGEAPGKRCFEFLFDRTEPCEVCETYKVLKTGTPLGWEWTGPDQRIYSVFDYPFTDTDGSTMILEMGIDVTDRKKAEEEIRTLNAELEERVAQRTAELVEANERLRKQGAVIAGIARIFRAALTASTEEELATVCLEVAEEVTASKFGFVGEVNPATGKLDNIAISDPGWAACRMPVNSTAARRTPMGFTIHGIYGRVVLEGKSLIANNPPEHPDSVGFPEGHPPLTSFLGAPLMQGDKVVGMIGLGNREGGYTAEQIEAAEALAPVIVQALLNKRAETAKAIALSRFELLAHTAGSLLRTGEPQRMVEDLCMAVMRHLDCDVFFNFLVDPSVNRLHLNAFAGIPAEEGAKIEWLDIGQAACGLAAKRARRVALHHIQITDDPYAQVVRNYGIKAYCAHPLLGSEGQVLGTLSFGTRGREQFSDDDLALMRVVADHVAVAITRTKAEEAVRESEYKYRQLVENLQEGIWTLDDKGVTTFVNPQLARMLGYTPEEMAGKHVADFVPESCADILRSNLEERSRGISSTHDSELCRKDGRVITVAISSVPIMDRQGTYLGALAGVVDVTERKEMEQRLRWELSVDAALAELFEPLLSSTASIENIAGAVLQQAQHVTGSRFGFIGAIDEATGICYTHTMNGTALSECEIPRNPTDMRFAPREDGTYGGLWGRCLNTRQAYYENRPVNLNVPAGHVPIEQFIGVPLTLDGKVVGEICLMNPGRDYNDNDLEAIKRIGDVYALAVQRMKAETALRESEERYRNLVEAAPIPMVMSKQNKIVFANRAFLRLLGTDRPSVAGEFEMEPFIHPQDLDRVRSARRKSVQEAAADIVEFRLKRLDNQVRHVEVVARPIEPDSGSSTLVIFRDITEQKHAQDLIRRHTEELERVLAERTEQIQKLERLRVESEKQAAIGRMAARIAHEINNPLAGIKNSFLLVKRAIPTDYKHYEFVGRIDRELDRIARIVRQMFEIYKPERSASAQFDVVSTIRDVTALLESNARLQGVKLEVESEEPSLSIKLHEDSLRQVLFSIIQNAIEASPHGARVWIRTKMEDHVLSVAIQDEGCGIPEEVSARIFEPFFTTKSDLETGGLGLGLSITKGVVEAMGGVLSFESEVGKGTTFEIVVPVSQEEKQEQNR